MLENFKLENSFQVLFLTWSIDKLESFSNIKLSNFAFSQLLFPTTSKLFQGIYFEVTDNLTYPNFGPDRIFHSLHKNLYQNIFCKDQNGRPRLFQNHKLVSFDIYNNELTGYSSYTAIMLWLIKSVIPWKRKILGKTILGMSCLCKLLSDESGSQRSRFGISQCHPWYFVGSPFSSLHEHPVMVFSASNFPLPLQLVLFTMSSVISWSQKGPNFGATQRHIWVILSATSFPTCLPILVCITVPLIQSPSSHVPGKLSAKSLINEFWQI